MAKATITDFGLVSGNDNTLFATWTWSKDNEKDDSQTEHYQTMWTYDTGDGVWFVGSDSTTKYKNCTWNIPAGAKTVKFKVKPISKTKDDENKSVYWTATWSTVKTYYVSNTPPTVPATPSIEIEYQLLLGYKLTTELDNLDLNATFIQFEVYKNNLTLFKTSDTTIRYVNATDSANRENGYARYTCYVDPGCQYKIRARSGRGSGKTVVYSDWSDFSANKASPPNTPSLRSGVSRATSDTSILVSWSSSSGADTYDIEYATKREYFDHQNDQVKSKTGLDGRYTEYELTGLETGQTYFFRVRAVNEGGESTWSSLDSITIGKEPAAPTTWSSTTTAITGEPLNLYWVHNTEDNSKQTYAELELTVNGNLIEPSYVIKNYVEDDEETNKTLSCSIDTLNGNVSWIEDGATVTKTIGVTFEEGTELQWRVRTAGITNSFGEWSVQRTVDIYAPPSLIFNITDANDNAIVNLESFPFYASALAGPNTQIPIGYHLSIVANESYQTIDNTGNDKMISKGDAVYSKYFDISTALNVVFTPSNIDLENNISYTATCTVTMDSGLTTQESVDFTVYWEDIQYEPNSEIGIDRETLSAYLVPYCVDENDVLIEDITLSVFRREYDGTFTEIMSNIENTRRTTIIDPHPALDYARYRIIATTKSTGAIQYYDMPGHQIGETSIVIQWDESWSSFDTDGDVTPADIVRSGSMIKLPYNLSVSSKYQQEVSMVNYAGRKHPVTYYGTQLGEGGSWSGVIDKKDTETLHLLRRLAIYMGDVYVREPSGVGFWANVTVTFPQKYDDLTIPVSMDITRVEGGM